MEQSPLHILFLCSWYPNPDEKSNGIFIKRHAQALASKHFVTVLFVKSTYTQKNTVQLKIDKNLKEILCFYPKLKFPFLGSIFKFFKFKSEYKKNIDTLNNKFDIIHLNTVFPAAIPALYAIIKNPKAKLFITEHWSGYYTDDGNYRGLVMKYFTKKIIEKAKAVFVISDKLKKAMQSHNLSANYELINNVVNTLVFKPNKSLKLNDGVLKILHVSSLVEKEKNISGIIAVAEKLKQHQLKFKLTIIGHNEFEIEAHQKNAFFKLTNGEIVFEGYKTESEIANFMNESDVFLLLSNYEGMPVVLLESLACGLPVITTNVGQVEKMIKANYGIVLKSNYIEDCVENLIKFNRENFLNAEQLNQEIENDYGFDAVSKYITQLYSKY